MPAIPPHALAAGRKYMIYNKDHPSLTFIENNANGRAGLLYVITERDGRLGFVDPRGVTFTVGGPEAGALEFYEPGAPDLPDDAFPRNAMNAMHYVYIGPKRGAKGTHAGHVNEASGRILQYGDKAAAPLMEAYVRDAPWLRLQIFGNEGGGAMGGAGGGGGGGGAMGGAGGGGAGGGGAAGGAGGGGKPLRANMSTLPTGHPNNVELRKERKKRTMRRMRLTNHRTYRRKFNRH
jgi:hypothetical protein